MSEKSYIDEKGYLRFKDSGILVHRYLAKKYIWEKDRKKYPLEFDKYQVHHKDKNIRNNDIDNLEVIEIREHELKHNVYRYEYATIETFAVFFALALSWFGYLGWVTHYKLTTRDVLFFGTTFIFMAILHYIINRKKKGVKYV